MPPAVRVLIVAAETLRPLGSHPALPAALRRTARGWVREWAQRQQSAAEPAAEACAPASYLEKAAGCLAEARAVLSALAAAAEPTADVLSSCPAGAKEEQTKPGGGGDDEEEGNDAGGAGGKKAGKGKGAAPKAGGKKAAAAAAAAAGGAAAGAAPEGVGAGEEAVGGAAPRGAVSTPLGRSLAMVQLEEACVRTMLGRARGEGRSSKKAKEAAASAEGVTPVQR